MKYRVLIVMAIALGIVFVPYWIGISIKDYLLIGDESRFIQWYFGFYLFAMVLGVGILLFFVIRFGIPALIDWIRCGNK